MIKTRINQTKLSPRAEKMLAEAKEEAKEQKKVFIIQLQNALRERLAKTDAKVKERFGNLKEELEAIASRKQKLI